MFTLGKVCVILYLKLCGVGVNIGKVFNTVLTSAAKNKRTPIGVLLFLLKDLNSSDRRRGLGARPPPGADKGSATREKIRSPRCEPTCIKTSTRHGAKIIFSFDFRA